MEGIRLFYVRPERTKVYGWIVHSYNGFITYTESVKRNTILTDDVKEISKATYKRMLADGKLRTYND